MRPGVAQRRIQAFRERFGEAHLVLATHAAFPLALTPDLLYHLWANFQQDIYGEVLNIPWLAVSDLLLSSLCDEVGHELYEMPKEIRSSLLAELKAHTRFGTKRINELSDFLLFYVEQQLESHDLATRDFAQAQRWTALAYIRPGQAASELRAALSKLKLQEQSEIIRMTSLVETLVEPLEGFEALLIYARKVLTLTSDKTKSVAEESATAALAEQISTEQTDKVVTTKANSKNTPYQKDAPGSSSFGYSYRNFQPDTEVLYTHFLNYRKIEQPHQLLTRLYHLFIEGQDYDTPEVLVALNRIVLSKWADQEFNAILNRCCHILMNYWWSYLGSDSPAAELIELFQASPTTSTSSIATRRLRELVRRFLQSDQYLELRQRVEVTKLTTQTSQAVVDRGQPIKDLVPRYPYLYPHCLMDWDSSDLGHQVMSQLQAKKANQFEQDLHRYAVKLLRQSQSAHPKTEATISNPTLLSDQQLKTAIRKFVGKAEGSKTYQELAQQTEATISNPTLLSDQQLETAIRKFVGKAEGSKTYQELAQQLISSIRQASSYQVVKRQIYSYLTASIENSVRPDYGRHHFNRWLANQLDETLSQNDTLEPSGELLVKTCGQLIDCLLASPRQQPSNHGVLVDLTTNLGATFTIGLLLKILLLCRDVKANLDAVNFYLAKRFAIILKHYETRVRNETEWLIELLENWLIASSIHFGQTDFSWIRLL